MLTFGPSFISNVFNDSAWTQTDYLTQQQAINLFISTSLLPSTPGVAQAGKLLQTNLSNSITSLNSLGLTTINQIGQYINTSSTDSTSTITGSMITSGGIGVAKNIFCSGQSIVAGTSQITLNSSSNSAGRSTVAFTNDISTYELGSRGSANGTLNNSMYIYNAGYLWSMGSTGNTSFLSTTDATSSTAGGAMTISGGTAIAKKLYVGSNCFLGTGSTGGVCIGTSNDTSRMLSCLNSNLGIASSNYITLGQAASNNNQAELSFYYAGAGSSNNRFQLGFYGGSRLVELAAGGTMTINSGIASTGQSNGSLVCVGGVGLSQSLFAGGSINAGSTATIGSSSNAGGTLSITGTGYHLAMYYSSTINSTINTSSAGDIVMSSNNGATNTYYTFANNGQIQLSGISARNGHKIDLGINVSKDNILVLGQLNNASASYMLGVNNSALQYVSASAHVFYANTSSTPAINGTENMRLSQQGSLILNNSGYHAYGSDITGLSSINSQGLHLQVASGIGTILNYNYNANTYGDLNLNSVLFVKASNSSVGIGTNSPTCPLEVNGTGLQSTSAGFTFITSSATGQAAGFTNRAFSLKTSGGIMVASGELDCLSDLRLKENVVDLSEDTCDRFIRNINPIEYSYSANPNKRHYGYGAQHLMREGLNVMVGACDADEPLDEEIIECADGSVIKLHSDSRLVVDILSAVPMLHKALQKALYRIDELVQICGKQQMQINELVKDTSESESEPETKATRVRRSRRI